MKTHFKYNSMFWRNWGHRPLSCFLGMFSQALRIPLTCLLHPWTMFQYMKFISKIYNSILLVISTLWSHCYSTWVFLSCPHKILDSLINPTPPPLSHKPRILKFYGFLLWMFLQVESFMPCWAMCYQCLKVH